MRGAALLALSVVALVTGAAASGSPSDGTSLRISYWEDDRTVAPTYVRTLRCDPVGGTVRAPARACRKLAAGGARLFAPLPRNIVCTEIYGGPQKARVVGTLDGRRVWSTFSRTNGCNIERWQRLSPWLLPPGGIT